MATTTTYHAQLIKYDSSGNQSILNLKNTGDDVSISRNSNGNLPSTVTSAQTLANAFGSLAFKSAVAWADVKGLASTELTVSSEGKLADARAIKALNDKIATNTSKIAQLNSNLGNKADKYKKVDTTLVSGTWSGSSIPYKYTTSVTGVTTTNDINIVLNSTDTVIANAWMDASVVTGTQTTNSITLYAYGKKPTTNIPITVLIGSEVSS